MDSKMPPMEIYTDGSCIAKNGGGGKGVGGIGYIIKHWEMQDGTPTIKATEGSRGFRLTTNNRMELLAAIEGLNTVSDGVKTGLYKDLYQINVMTDSRYLCDAVSQNWVTKWINNNWVTSMGSPVKNRDMWEKVMDSIKRVTDLNITLNFHHVQAHSGNVDNERADFLAVSAAKDANNHEVDAGYEGAMGR